jgi:hypothetical protein
MFPGTIFPSLIKFLIINPNSLISYSFSSQSISFQSKSPADIPKALLSNRLTSPLTSVPLPTPGPPSMKMTYFILL